METILSSTIFTIISSQIDFPHILQLRGSANGLLFLRKKPDVHRVCNPITREYIEVSCPNELIRPNPTKLYYREIIEKNMYRYAHSVTYGFGVSKISGQYKVVRITHDSVIVYERPPRKRIIHESECYVYTLGTGLWRRLEVEAGAHLDYSCASCVFLNGNLYWTVLDSNENLWISCFNLETECFSHFSTPPIVQDYFLTPGMSVLGDCLCLCGHSVDRGTVIWLMNEYEVKKSWTKEYVINIDHELGINECELIYPIKLFEDGDILMLQGDLIFYYSSKTRTTQEIDIFTIDYRANSTLRVNAILVTPSFVSLKSFGVENAISF